MMPKNAKSPPKTYYAIGRVGSKSEGFREITVQGGSAVRVMSSGLYTKAAKAGGKTLRDFVTSNRNDLRK